MPKTRGKHEGSFRTRPDGLVEGRVKINYTEYSIYAHSKTEAKLMIKDLVRSVGLGKGPSKTAMTLGAWLDQWIENLPSTKIQASTITNYGYMLKHIPAPMRKIPLGKLRPADIQHLIKVLIKTPLKQRCAKNVPTKTLAPRTISLVRHTLRVALNAAVKQGLISFNPALDIELPLQTKSEMMILSREQINLLAASAPELREAEPLYPAALLIAFTGMRRGEALALRWSDIDLTAGYLIIHKSLTKKVGGKGLTDPKNTAAKRLVPIPDLPLTELRILKKRSPSNTLVFCHPDGTAYYPDSLRKILLRILKKIELPPMKVHGLRHTFASILLHSGENPKVVQELLGHSDIKTTLGTYSHTIPSLKIQASKNFENFLNPPEETIDPDPELIPSAKNEKDHPEPEED